MSGLVECGEELKDPGKESKGQGEESKGREKESLRKGTVSKWSDAGAKKVRDWSVENVSEWLVAMQLSHHVACFHDNQLDGKGLEGLGRRELIRLGVSEVGERMVLERAIKRLFLTHYS